MDPIAAVWDTICLLVIVLKAGGHHQGKRIYEGKTDYLRARIEDIEGSLLSASAQPGKKRKRDEAFFSCVTKGQELVQEARSLLGHKEQNICFSRTCAKLLNLHKLTKRLSAHEKDSSMILTDNLPDGRGPGRGNLIPVRELFGQGASVAMEQLQALLKGNEVGRIAIRGIKGIGKSFLMKHLHNSVLNWDDRFDHVFWVTTPRQFSIKCVQDAIAAALKCQLCSEDNVIRRAEILSEIFAGLGSFVIFLDDVPEAYFSLAQIGIPVPAKGGERKLVLSSRSTLVSRMLDCSGAVSLDPLSDEESCQLFVTEARISKRSASLLESIPSLLANICDGVPHNIIEIASHMRGIDDPHEWNNALFESRRSSEG